MGIHVRKALAPFRRRLMAEAIMRSAAASGLAVLPVWLVLAAAQRVLFVGGALLPVMPALWALGFALAYLLRYRVTDKRLAARLDALGQQERLGTMVEFAGSDSVLCRMQREDALAHLGQLSPGMLKIRCSAPRIAVCLVLLALIAAVPHVPQAIIDALPIARSQESEEGLLLRGKIMDMRAQVEASDIKDSDRQTLLAQLDAMLAQLESGHMALASLQEIQRLMDDMTSTVAELTPRDTYAAVLLEFESLRPLGEAIFKQNMDVVRLVFDNIEYTLMEKEGTEQVNALMDLVYDINTSLAKPIRDKSQENLRQAMMMMAGGLESAAQMVFNGRDNAQMIETALFGAEEYIREYLGVPATEERYDPYANKTPEPGPVRTSRPPAGARATAEPVQAPTQTEYVYDPPESALLGGYAPGEMDEQGRVQRQSAPDVYREGTVPYGTVYGAYYAKYLDELSAGAIPEALQDAAQAYFDGI